jgi:hypothetical protein
MLVSTQAGDFNGLEPSHAIDDLNHPERVTTLSTAIVPFSTHAVPTTVVSLGPVRLLVYPATRFPPY